MSIGSSNSVHGIKDDLEPSRSMDKRAKFLKIKSPFEDLAIPKKKHHVELSPYHSRSLIVTHHGLYPSTYCLCF